jgi:hypothetical protein
VGLGVGDGGGRVGGVGGLGGTEGAVVDSYFEHFPFSDRCSIDGAFLRARTLELFDCK